MNPLPSPLDRPASIPVLRRLLAVKAITTEECAALEKRTRRDLPWKTWLDRGLLALGVVLILAGIGYFFAHNWDHLTDDDKLGLSGGAILFSLIGATWAGLERFPGKLLLLAASALVGVFLAVFGQVYQTASDTYDLFTGWAVLIFPWVALGRFIPLWLGWLALLNLAAGFYWPVSFFDTEESWNLMRHECISLFLMNLTALLVREGLGRRNIAWFDRGWSALVLLAATLAPATVEIVSDIIQSWGDQPVFGALALSCVLYAVFVVGLGYYYSKVRYSLPALSLITLSACITLTVLAARVIVNDDHPGGDTGIFFLMGIVVLAIFGGGVFFLRRQRLAHQH